MNHRINSRHLPRFIERLANMGRTVPSLQMMLEGLIEDLSVFRRALRGKDKVAFDCLMNKAREHASSCTIVPLLFQYRANETGISKSDTEVGGLKRLLSIFSICIPVLSSISSVPEESQVSFHQTLS